MRSICAWCFPNAPQGEEAEEITHGICPFHMEQMRLEAIAYWRKEAEREGQSSWKSEPHKELTQEKRS